MSKHKKKMKFWMDTEFLEDGYAPIHLLSIGIVSEDGREYYAVNAECPLDEANAWVKENVLPFIDMEGAKPREQIRLEIEAFIGHKNTPEFWAYCGDYDWVVFCGLFGNMAALSDDWPHYCRDVRQWADRNPAAKLPPELPGLQHHALWDARWCRMAYDYLDMFERGRKSR